MLDAARLELTQSVVNVLQLGSNPSQGESAPTEGSDETLMGHGELTVRFKFWGNPPNFEHHWLGILDFLGLRGPEVRLSDDAS
jgi:hypothetical protein